jgi:uncharacterized protein (DUF427 family)
MALSPAFAANPGHVITITPATKRLRVTFKGTQIADSARTLILKEGAYPPCFYVPRDDCRMEYFVETAHQTKCPFKGTARYWSLSTKDGTADNAVWGYDDPFDQMAAIDRHVAFYPDKVEFLEG